MGTVESSDRHGRDPSALQPHQRIRDGAEQGSRRPAPGRMGLLVEAVRQPLPRGRAILRRQHRDQVDAQHRQGVAEGRQRGRGAIPISAGWR